MSIATRAWLALAGSILLAAGQSPATAGNQCGCERLPCATCEVQHVYHHRCRGCCHHRGSERRESGESRAAPAGPIVESVPMMRMMPLVAAPMMMASYVSQAADRALPREEPSCRSSSSRIDQLDERFSALERRVDTLQVTLENQTAILEAIKAKLDSK
jgi:hypothetical protein